MFIDEALSWDASDGSPREVLDGVRATEISPPAHYYGLWAWVNAFGIDEWVMRLPSAMAGVCLVLVVFRLGSLVFGARAGLVSALLAALSPLVLTYAQQARPYVFAMLLVGVAVLVLLEADRADSQRTRGTWLVIGGVVAVVAFWTHYTAGLVLAPLLVWTCTQEGFGRRAKVALVAAVLLSWAASLPLLTEQLSHDHQLGIAAFGTLTVDHVVSAVGTPFDGRLGRMTVWSTAGAAVVALAAAAALGWSRGERRSGTVLIAAAAVSPVLAVIGVTAVSDDVLLTRYTAVAAPFMLVMIGGAVVRAPRALGVGVGCAAVMCAAATTVLNHGSGSFYPDVRSAYEEIGAGYRPGDAITVSGYASLGPITEYYRGQLAPQAPSALLPGMDAQSGEAIRERRRVWILASGAPNPSAVGRALAPLGYRLDHVTTHEASGDLQLVLAVPR